MSDVVLIDFRVYKYTMTEVFGMIRVLKRMMPQHEIYMDGDRLAIVGKKEALA